MGWSAADLEVSFFVLCDEVFAVERSAAHSEVSFSQLWVVGMGRSADPPILAVVAKQLPLHLQ